MLEVRRERQRKNPRGHSPFDADPIRRHVRGCGCSHDYTFKERQHARAAEQALRRVRPDHDVAQALGEELGSGALLLRRSSSWRTAEVPISITVRPRCGRSLRANPIQDRLRRDAAGEVGALNACAGKGVAREGERRTHLAAEPRRAVHGRRARLAPAVDLGRDDGGADPLAGRRQQFARDRVVRRVPETAAALGRRVQREGDGSGRHALLVIVGDP